MRKIILASKSPRRIRLLKQLGLKFVIDPSDYHEDMSLAMPPRPLAKFLALEKGKAVAKKHRGGIVIAADTFVYLDGKILGKPKDAHDAVRHLKKIGGRFHTVYSGIAVIDVKTGKSLTESEETKVKIKKLSPHEIHAYVATGEPLDKAGAYAIQGLGGALVEEIDGDYFNVIGLPISKLSILLKKFGVQIF